MYHIKSDKRSQSSASEIVRGLGECLKTIPLKSVTVMDIHRVTGISRATFYRLFDNIEDVLHYQFDRMAESSDLRYTQVTPFSPKLILEENIAKGFEQHEFLKALVDNGRFDLLFQYTERSFRSLDRIYPIFPTDMDAVERSYIIANLSMSLVATLITWARNGQKDSPNQITVYMERYARVLTGLLGD